MSTDVAPGEGIYLCCDPRRRDEIARLIESGATGLNGLDFLEVLDTPTQAPAERQRTLFVHFIADPTPLGIVADNVRIEGGERIRDIRVVSADVRIEPLSGSGEPVLVVVVDTPGDFSTYRLRLEPSEGSPLPGLDQVLRRVDFSFKVTCPTPFDPIDAARRGEPAPEPPDEPSLDYLARDFDSLRRLMLDRMAILVPGWTERNPVDLGVALVELLAYVGDLLSYRQDAVATEAYLGTCRRRVSARRHARLVDYFMHDGSNARAWVQVRLEEGVQPFELAEATFHSAVPGLLPRLEPGSRESRAAASSAATTFQLLEPALLTPDHNEIDFHTWGARECWLPRGAVRATLRGDLPDLQPGMVLVLQERLSPRTGDPDDAELTHRHAVRLRAVEHGSDPVGGHFDEPPTSGPVPVAEIRWDEEDALPFALCISAETTEDGGRFVDRAAVALGNIVLADHGSPAQEELGVVPAGRFRPTLTRGPLTQAVPHQGPAGSASAALRYAASDALPAITLDDGSSEPWEPRLDLLASGDAKHVVVEVEADGEASTGGRLRFGSGQHGAAPPVGRTLTASYRVGNGPAGNVGAETLVHVVCAPDGIAEVRNPLPASGGVVPESIDEVRQRAPVAFRPRTVAGQPGRPVGDSLRRAVTPTDYAAVAEAASLLAPEDVQRASATVRWTGSWRTMSVTVDRRGGGPVDPEFEAALRQHLEPYRMAGHDLEIEPPRPVSLHVAMRVRVRPGYFESHVRRELLDLFSNRRLPDGRRGVFHPDNLTFGQTIHLSPLYAAAQQVPGVASVDITTFERTDRPGTEARDTGRLTLGRLELARLDNDPNFPERGSFELTMEASR